MKSMSCFHSIPCIMPTPAHVSTNDGAQYLPAGDRKDATTDLAVLSLGDDVIMSYGTFSFMGAVLARGTITQPVSVHGHGYNHFDCVASPLLKDVSRD